MCSTELRTDKKPTRIEFSFAFQFSLRKNDSEEIKTNLTDLRSNWKQKGLIFSKKEMACLFSKGQFIASLILSNQDLGHTNGSVVAFPAQ